MDLKSYVKGRLPDCLIATLAGGATLIILRALGFDPAATLVVLLIAIFSLVASIAIGYLRKRSFYRQLTEAALALSADGRAQLVGEVIDEPTFPEGRAAYESIALMGKSMSDRIAASERKEGAYREFIEAWIHEVKSPIAVLRLVVAGAHDTQAEKVRREADRIEGYVEQALYYARSTSLEKDSAIREIGLGGLARDAVKKNATFLIERNVAPRISISEGMTVLADEKWLKFILGQLLVNAAKYGARSIEVTAVDEGESSAGRTVLSIEDDGFGISESDALHVFEKGFVGENGRKVGSSTGIGLYLCSSMCAKMGIGISLSSAVGMGTSIRLSFPHDRRSFELMD